MTYGDGRYIIVFNGEIYNFLELRKELASRGYRFQTDSDTEVIPAAYDCWGRDCIKRFNGMWAFALWDCRERELWLCRDRFGEKPLYYLAQGALLAFASEVQAVHRWMRDSADWDDDVIRSIALGRFEYHGTHRTYSKGISILPAGHSLIWKGGKTALARWYELVPGAEKVPRSFAKQAMQLRDLIVDSCRLRLRSDVSMGTCLSGGVDSSTIASIIHKRAETQGERTAQDCHRAFCAGFPQTILDETAPALALSKNLGLELLTHEVNAPTPDRLLAAIRTCDGPMHSMAFFPIWSLYGFIRSQGIRVTLDGQGPDEMLGGYTETFGAAFMTALLTCNPVTAAEAIKAYSGQGENEYRSSRGDVRRQFAELVMAPARSVRAAIRPRQDLVPQEPEWLWAQPTPEGCTPLQRELHAQFCQRQLPTILQQFDRCSMAHGVESRMPFMDHRIVEFCFSLPARSLVRRGYAKAVLREAARGLLIDSIRLERKKIGFNAPIVEWFVGPLREFISDTMTSRSFQERSQFDGIRIRRNFEKWQKSPDWNSAWAFWPPVHIHLWLNEIGS